MNAHFYVTLKDDFTERCRELDNAELFGDMENPWLEARKHLTPGKTYPVMGAGQHSLRVIDDFGRLWTASTGLFKYAQVPDERHF